MAKNRDADLWLLVENSHPQNMILSLEPWGETHDIPPNGSLTLCVRGPAPAGVHIDSSDEYFTVYCPSGSTVFLYRDGEPDGIERPRVPNVPAGFFGHLPDEGEA